MEWIPGIGDYTEPEPIQDYEEWLEETYAFGEDRSPGWDEPEDGRKE